MPSPPMPSLCRDCGAAPPGAAPPFHRPHRLRRLLRQRGEARGEDARLVQPERDTKSISAETTFDTDLTNPALLEKHLWRMAEKLARRLRKGGFSAGGVVLKLKTARFVSRTCAQRLPGPTVLPDGLFHAGRVCCNARPTAPPSA